ncbi:MAG TPA: asparagine synthase (glutamine-hydrolyzing) [Rudaea sp.]|nr:asparagine synthase (glutamine-hydrolyzing) [Rudaea sp.]
MCGILAWFGADGTDVPLDGLHAALERMRRRGPDDSGFWHEDGVVLGHRRLAILDLDHRAAQPMFSSCGRYGIVYNGEIYNFRQLRDELGARSVIFRTTSDTEVILELFAREGEAMLPKLQGMFAFVIWDRAEKRAFIARDAYGIKPLYIARCAGGLLVGSQVRALLASGQVSREADLGGQAKFWMLGSVPEPHTWYRDIEALPAGHFGWIESGRSKVRRWCDIAQAWHSEPAPAKVDVQECVRAALLESVSRHQVSDVPVGLFLSGGIDSCALARLMMETGAVDLQCITLAYDEFAGQHDDEAPVAAQFAARNGMQHVVRRVGEHEFFEDLPRIVAAMDQPSVDGINTWYASKAAAERGLKVVVSGVGGDELFMGYSSFRRLPRLLAMRRLAGMIPGAAAGIASLGRWKAKRSGNPRWRHLGDWTTTIQRAWWLTRGVFAPEELAGVMGEEAAREALSGFDVDGCVDGISGQLPNDPKLALAQIESTAYLRNQLLRDSDWASMDHSVELRTPLVDTTLLQALSPLFPRFAMHPGKRLLAHAPSNPLPTEIVARSKTGFGIPIGRWMAKRWSRPVSRWAAAWTKELVPLYESSA